MLMNIGFYGMSIHEAIVAGTDVRHYPLLIGEDRETPPPCWISSGEIKRDTEELRHDRC